MKGSFAFVLGSFESIEIGLSNGTGHMENFCLSMEIEVCKVEGFWGFFGFFDDLVNIVRYIKDYLVRNVHNQNLLGILLGIFFTSKI